MLKYKSSCREEVIILRYASQVEEDMHNKFIPIETSHRLDDHSAEISNYLNRNPINYPNNVNLQYNTHREELVDQHIRYLQGIRKTLMCLKQEANIKFKNKVRNIRLFQILIFCYVELKVINCVPFRRTNYIQALNVINF